MKSEQGLEQGGKLEVQSNTEAMEEHSVPFGLLILLLTQLRPVSLRVTSLTVGRPSAPIIFQGNALLWWNHSSLEALSLFPSYSSLFQVDKKLTSTSLLCTKSHPTRMIHYTNIQLISKAQPHCYYYNYLREELVLSEYFTAYIST